MRYLCIALTVAAAVIPFAHGRAQADVEAGPAVIQVPSWSGAYVGLTVGYSFANTELDVGGLFTVDGLGADGLQGGVIGGFNWQVSPRFVVGVEADANLGQKATLLPTTTNNWSWAVRGRAGVPVSPQTLLYLSGGWSWAHIDGPNALPPGALDMTFSGPQLGAGLESMLTQNLLVRLEYLMSFYDGEPVPAGFPPPGLTIAPITGAARLGVIYKFGEGMVAAPIATAAPGSSWTGPYAGLNGGYGLAGFEESLVGVFPPGLIGHAGLDGVVGGGMVGLDWQLAPNIVVGAEVDGALADIGVRFRAPGSSFDAQVDWAVAVRGRVGFLVNPATMIYGLAGWSWAGVEESNPGVISASETADGPQFGLGIEARFTDAVSARAEYRHTFYEASGFGMVLPTVISPTVGEARLGLVYKFHGS